MIVLFNQDSDYIFKIPDIGLFIFFYPDEIKIFDLHTKEFLLQEELTDDYDRIEEDTESDYSYYLMKGDESVYHVVFSPLRQEHKITTEAGYILHVGVNDTKGFYAGLYEFGTFELTEEKITIDKKILHQNISYGLLNHNNNLFYLCRGSKGIECWDWQTDEPRKKWSKDTISVSKGLIVAPNNTVVIGTKEGTIYNIDEEGQVLFETIFEKESIRHMIWTNACVSLTDKNYIYKFSLHGEKKLLWKTKLPSIGPNHSLSYVENKIWITTYLGELLVIDNENGNIEAIHQIVKENFSPITILEKNWIVYTSPEKVQCKLFQKEGKNDEFSLFFKDKMVRALTPIENGVIVGDDEGDLTLLKRPGIEIRKLSTVQKLMEFDPTR